MDLEPLLEKPYLATGLWRQLAVHLFQGKVTLADMDELEADSALSHARVKAKLVELVVILPSKAEMTHEERVRMARIIKRWEKQRVASATVVAAEGLLASIHRSVLTGLQLLVPPPHPTKVFASTPLALRWLEPYVKEVCGPEATTGALVDAVEGLQKRFATRRVRAPG